MIPITHTIAIDEMEIHEEFVHASGPGGQNVNKVATAVQLRFDVRNSPSLSADVRARLIRLSGKRITEKGVLIINACRFRSQKQNRRDAIGRLVELVRAAARKPVPRRKTHSTVSSRIRRLEAKRRHGDVKQRRRSVSPFVD
jgi:ribosome-associated protein